MSLIIFAIIVIVIIALAMYLIQMLTMIPPTPRVLLQALVVLFGIYVIGERAGLWM